MKRICSMIFIFASLFVMSVGAQTKPKNIKAGPSAQKARIVSLPRAEQKDLTYDAGTARLLASSADTSGAFSLFELIEMPGYKTAYHQHNHNEESFYVLEGVLTVNLNGKIAEYPAGSYVLIPRGTPHGQGCFGKVPARVLMMMTPKGYEGFFLDRVELFKTVKPDSPEFLPKFTELRKKWAGEVEILGSWGLPGNWDPKK